MKNQKLLGGVLALALVATSITPAFAADITTNGGNSSVPVELTTEAATFSVAVPTTLPIDVNAAGVVTTADDVAIVNNSHGAVKVTNMTIEGADTWEIVNWDSANMPAEKVGATKVAMTINGDKTTADDTITFTASNFPKMDGANTSDSDELPIFYDAKVPAQATELSDLTVANVVFTVGWDTATEVAEEEEELISFTITNEYNNKVGTFYALPEMTWEKFFNYNYHEGEEGGWYTLFGIDGVNSHWESITDNETSIFLDDTISGTAGLSDEIIEGYNYYVAPGY